MQLNVADLGNTKEHWNKIWEVWRGADRPAWLKKVKNMSDGNNSKEYWDEIWKNPKRRYEKYAMQRAWWHIKQEKPKSVLDVGCANGRLLFGIKDDVDYCYGIDISDVAIERMKRIYGVEGEVMDCDDLHKLDKTFDFVVCNHVLEHVILDGHLVEACKNKLNPGGVFYCAVPGDMSYPEVTGEHVRKYNRSQLEMLLKKIFGNAEMSRVGNHLIGLSRKNGKN